MPPELIGTMSIGQLDRTTMHSWARAEREVVAGAGGGRAGDERAVGPGPGHP